MTGGKFLTKGRLGGGSDVGRLLLCGQGFCISNDFVCMFFSHARHDLRQHAPAIFVQVKVSHQQHLILCSISFFSDWDALCSNVHLGLWRKEQNYDASVGS